MYNRCTILKYNNEQFQFIYFPFVIIPCFEQKNDIDLAYNYNPENIFIVPMMSTELSNPGILK